MPPRIGLPETFFLCVFDAVFEKSFLDFLFGMELRLAIFCPPDGFLDTGGVMGHIDIKEYNMPHMFVKPQVALTVPVEPLEQLLIAQAVW